MSDDYKVQGLSNSEIRMLAKKARARLGIADKEYVEILDLESASQIWTVLGTKPFRLEAVSDDELPHDAGLTTYDGTRILTRIRRTVRHDALLGHGYSRFTIAHELCHVTIHPKCLISGASMPRRSVGNIKPQWIPKFQSAEHHAGVFAAAFLINDDIARGLSSADEIAVRFGLSLEAARIYYEQMLEEIDRPTVAERVRRKADEFKATVAEKSAAKHTISFLDDPCLSCGRHELFPVNGSSYMCNCCGMAYNRYQDGDPAG